MRLTSPPVWFDLATDLVDEALLAAARSAAPELRKRYHEEREAIGSIEIVDIREERFRQLDSQWAERFRIDASLSTVLNELEGLAQRISGCVLHRVRVDSDEGASLEANETDVLPVIYLRLKAESLFSLERLREIVQSAL
jgi:hypothetical protein